MPEKTHQKFSASSATRWIACPGCIAASASCPRQPPNDFADEGTAGHMVAEYCLRFECEPGGAAVIVNDKPYEVDEEMQEGVQLYLDTVDAAPGKLFIEEEFLLEPDLGGTADAAKYDDVGRRLHVFDFKYGRRPVLAGNNPQLAIYGMGMLKRFPEAKTITMVIVQPRVVPSVTTWSIDAGDFRTWYGSKVLTAYRKALEPNAPRFAGTHCRYCPAFSSLSCPESRKQLVTATCSDFDLAAPGPVKLPPLETLTNEQIARLMDFTDLLSDYAKAAKQAAHDRMMAGQTIPGWKIVQKRSNREWVDPQATIDALGVVLGKNIFTAPELLSPAQMEKALKAAGRDPKAVEPLTQKPDAGLSIAPESDKRKEVVPQIGSDFAGNVTLDLV